MTSQPLSRPNALEHELSTLCRASRKCGIRDFTAILGSIHGIMRRPTCRKDKAKSTSCLSEAWQERSFHYAPMNDRDPNSRPKSITEIRGTVSRLRHAEMYTQELLEGSGSISIFSKMPVGHFINASRICEGLTVSVMMMACMFRLAAGSKISRACCARRRRLHRRV